MAPPRPGAQPESNYIFDREKSRDPKEKSGRPKKSEGARKAQAGTLWHLGITSIGPASGRRARHGEDLVMPTYLPLRANQTSRLAAQLRQGALIACVLSLVALAGLIGINGPQIRAEAEAREARIVGEENRAFCGKFGIDAGTSRYAECAAGLADIRARALERSASDSIL
jgi:hypothetical protein